VPIYRSQAVIIRMDLRGDVPPLQRCSVGRQAGRVWKRAVYVR